MYISSGLRKADPTKENSLNSMGETWQSIKDGFLPQQQDKSHMSSSIIILAFLALTYITPVVLWKISRVVFKDYLPPWAKGVGNHYVCVALQDFKVSCLV